MEGCVFNDEELFPIYCNAFIGIVVVLCFDTMLWSGSLARECVWLLVYEFGEVRWTASSWHWSYIKGVCVVGRRCAIYICGEHLAQLCTCTQTCGYVCWQCHHVIKTWNMLLLKNPHYKECTKTAQTHSFTKLNDCTCSNNFLNGSGQVALVKAFTEE